jgi:hypothetical protein
MPAQEQLQGNDKVHLLARMFTACPTVTNPLKPRPNKANG